MSRDFGVIYVEMCDVHGDKCVSNEHEINFVIESFSCNDNMTSTGS